MPHYLWRNGNEVLIFKAGPTVRGLAIPPVVGAALLNVKSGKLKELKHVRRLPEDWDYVYTSSISPDGRWLLWSFHCNGNGSPSEQILTPIAGGKSIHEPPLTWFCGSVVWMPDSKSWITFGGALDGQGPGARVDVWKVPGFEHAETRPIRGLPVRKDGAYHLLGLRGDTLILVWLPYHENEAEFELFEQPLNTEKRATRKGAFRLPKDYVSVNMKLSPDGKRIAWDLERSIPGESVETDMTRSEIWISDCDGSNLKPLGWYNEYKTMEVYSNLSSGSVQWLPNGNYLSYVTKGQLWKAPIDMADRDSHSTIRPAGACR